MQVPSVAIHGLATRLFQSRRAHAWSGAVFGAEALRR